MSKFLIRRLKLHDFVLARNQLTPYLAPTPLRHSNYLSDLTGANVWLKLESLQPTGSFKVRGALTKLLNLDRAGVDQLIAASAGNHGLGLAYAAAALDTPQVTIVVPETAPQTKIDKLRRYPIILRLAGATFAEAHQTADDIAAETGAQIISAYDDVDIILGQGTCGLEIMLDLPQTDLIFVPTGGGGLLSGVALAAKGINPLTRIVGVQPEASPAAQLSFQQGQPIDPYNHEPTLADGLAGGFGAVPFYLARALVDSISLHSELELRRAVFTLLHQEQLVVEPSGAIAVAPLLNAADTLAGLTIVCILTGGNVDSALLNTILSEFIETGHQL